jgi:hypothetical protein
MRSERGALLLSAIAAALLAAIGIAAAVVTGSGAILLDGLFNLCFAVTAAFTLRVARLVALPDDADYPFGYLFFEPLINTVKGLLILGVSAFALSRMTVACRAYGLRPIDGPFGDFSDPAGYTAGAKRAAALGIEGKWAIHPSQIELANAVFSPTPKEVERAERIIVALKEAEAQGKGAASLDGKMIDAASEKMAKNLIATAAAIKANDAARQQA